MSMDHFYRFSLSSELLLMQCVLAADLEPPSRKSQIEQGHSTLCAQVSHSALFKPAKAGQQRFIKGERYDSA